MLVKGRATEEATLKAFPEETPPQGTWFQKREEDWKKDLASGRDAEPLQLLRVSVAAAVPQERRVCETKG